MTLHRSLIGAILLMAGTAAAEPWKRHVIDDQFKGADGVKLADVNADGLPDVTTGFESSGVTRVYLNPGPDRSKSPWPAVTVGKTPDVEDALLIDLDRDGRTDVVTCTEGKTRSVFVHWAPRDTSDYLKSEKWKTEAFPALAGKQQWMFCIPMNVDDRNGLDLVIGSKGDNASIGWLECPPDPRNLADWKWHALRPASWIMSLVTSDMDADGDPDSLASDRKADRRGVFWLENPGNNAAGNWIEHPIGAQNLGEVMFLQQGDLDRDGLADIVVAVKPRSLIWLRRTDKTGKNWQPHTIPFPDSAGRAKAVAIADVDLDGKNDLLLTCESADADRPGVLWLSYDQSPTERTWTSHDISGPRGTKYDLIEMLDLDADGDLDLLTTEETDINAIIWYENPNK
jgi:hypothetical protein